MDQKTAHSIVNSIFSELEGRGGFDILNIIHSDTEVYNEMHATCVKKVIRVADEGSNKSDDALWTPEQSGGWYIVDASVCEYGNDLLTLNVTLNHPKHGKSDIEETLDPSIGDIRDYGCEEYGGIGREQQSIVVTAENEDHSVCLQIEIDHESGEIDGDGLLNWEES